MPLWWRPLPDAGPGVSSQQSQPTYITHEDDEEENEFMAQEIRPDENIFIPQKRRPVRIVGSSSRKRASREKPDVALKRPVNEPKFNPFKSYREYYKGKHYETQIIKSGLSASEYEALKKWTHPEESLLESYGKGHYFQNATLDVYKPSAKEKLMNKMKSAYRKSFFGIVDEKLERTERELLSEYATGKMSGKGLYMTSFAVGLARPVLNPPKFLYNVATAPVVLAKSLYEKVKDRNKRSEPKSLLEKRLSKGHKVMLAGEVTGSIFGSTVIMPHVDYGLAKLRGYWRTRGLPKLEPEEVISRDVLTGKSNFPMYPSKVARASQTTKIKYLYSLNKSPRKAVERAVGVADEESKFLGFHATNVEFPKVTTVLKGSSEAPGLYMAPVTSPHFLRLTTPTETTPYISLRSITSLKKFFGKPLFTQKPTILAIYTKSIKPVPKSFLKIKSLKTGDRVFWNFMMSRQGTGEAYISWRTAALKGPWKTEMEAIATPGSLLTRVSKGGYTVYKGIRIPVRVYKLLPSESASPATRAIAKGVRASRYSSLRIETPPYGTYSLLGGFGRGVSAGRYSPLTQGMRHIPSRRTSTLTTHRPVESNTRRRGQVTIRRMTEPDTLRRFRQASREQSTQISRRERSGSGVRESGTRIQTRSSMLSFLRRIGYRLPEPDVYYPRPEWRERPSQSGSGEYREPSEPPYPPPRPPEPPRYPPKRRRIYPRSGESPDTPPRTSSPRPPTSPPRRISLASTVTSVPRRSSPNYLLSTPPRPRIREDKRTIKKGRPKGRKAIKKGKWKRKVPYMHYLSGFGQALTMHSLSGWK